MSAAAVRAAARPARPAASGSTENATPSATPCRGCQPPKNSWIGAAAESTSSAAHIPAVAKAIASASTSSRRGPSNGPSAAIAAAPSSGTATVRGTSACTRSAAQRSQLVRVERSAVLLHLDREREQERADRHPDDDVRQRQGL